MTQLSIFKIDFITLFAAILSAAVIACGPGDARHARDGADLQDMGELTVPITVQIINGTMTAILKNNEFIALKQGQTVTGCSELTVDQGHGMVTLGDHGRFGALWLRQNSHVKLGQSLQGDIQLQLIRGEARLALKTRSISVRVLDMAHRDGREITTTDVMMFHNSMSAQTDIVPTAARPDLARWTVQLTGATDPAGLGTLTTGTDDDKVALSLKSVHITATQHGDVVLNRVEHIFHNDADSQLEGTFRFPLPDGAIITGLAMEIDGKLMEGELVEREKARKTYESIVDAMRDPALLEWQQGQIFKLRVFPIEPKRTKRIVVKFLSPLRKTPSGEEYVYPTAAADMQRTIDRFTFKWNGRTILDRNKYRPGQDVVVPVHDAHAVSPIFRTIHTSREYRSDGVFVAVQLSPFDLLIGSDTTRTFATKKRSQHLIVILDTSRSALENTHLTNQSLSIVLDTLRPTDRFTVIASDIDATPLTEYAQATAENSRNATRRVAAIDRDGASNMEAAIAAAAAVMKRHPSTEESIPHILYIGDGIPTWGETDHTALVQTAKDKLNGAMFSAIVSGNNADGELIADLAAISGGRTDTPRSAAEVSRFALFVAGAPYLPRLTQVRLKGHDGVSIYPTSLPTCFTSEPFTVYAHATAENQLPDQLTLSGMLNGKRVSTRVSLTANENGVHSTQPYISNRYGALKIAELQKDGVANRDEIIKTSLEYGIMSKYTSFLVLESEEAYRQYGIERRNRTDGQSPRITGQDLESLNDAQAGLNPSHIQPGDPEIRIPAPENARSVVVVFPFGETKIATWEPAMNSWVVRFLIDRDTPEGIWEVLVRITHDDGKIEIVKLNYTVDTTAPTVTLQLCPNRNRHGWVKLIATQIETPSDMESATPRFRTASPQIATFIPDLRRVEVELNSGRILKMKRMPETGEFVAHINQHTAPQINDHIRVIGFDRALNVSEEEATVEACHE